jgi:hypothetical protein
VVSKSPIDRNGIATFEAFDHHVEQLGHRMFLRINMFPHGNGSEAESVTSSTLWIDRSDATYYTVGRWR